MPRTKSVALLIAGLLLATLFGHCADAEVRVQGPADAVQVEAQAATVTEILAALSERYAVRYRGTPATSSLTGSFEGPLRRVVARVLAGYDYIIAARRDGLEVIVLSAGPPSAAAGPPPLPASVVRNRGN